MNSTVIANTTNTTNNINTTNITNTTTTTNRSPSEFLKQSFGRPVTVKLTNGTKYKGNYNNN